MTITMKKVKIKKIFRGITLTVLRILETPKLKYFFWNWGFENPEEPKNFIDKTKIKKEFDNRS